MLFGNMRLWWWPAAGALGAGGAVIAGGLGGWWWGFDLVAPFQLQYTGVLVLCLVALLLLRRWRWALVAALLLVLPALRVVPCWVADRSVATRAQAQPLRVLSFNLLSSNQNHDGVLRWVRETDPDLAFFAEVTPEWAAALGPLRATLPYSSANPQTDNFGYALFSKFPLDSVRHLEGSFAAVTAIRAELVIHGVRVVVIGAHPPPPLSATLARERNQFLQTLADEAAAATTPLIIMGDLNATPWCHGIKPLWAAGVRDARRGPHYGPTWQATNPVLAIPIDHLLLKGAVAVERYHTGPPLGSDHRAVVGDLRL